jgi:hypothetical protein
MLELKEFLIEWESNYLQKISKVDMFNLELVKNWDKKQQKYFAEIFYHARGHFQDFVWYIGNHAIDKETKDIILKNIGEELNDAAKSHEALYLEFANSVGADVSSEFIDEKNYLPFVKDFNKGQVRWLHEHDADQRFAALAAYEKLDNIDYAYLLDMVKALGVDKKGQMFYKIHTLVEHFAPTLEKLETLWSLSHEKVIEAFDFIGEHQLKMWNNLSKEIFAFKH